MLEAARVKSAVVVGHSMGVQLALEFHRLHAERVRALVLVSGSPGHPLDTFHDTTLLRRALPSLRKGAERFPRVAAALTRVGVRSGLAMEVAMSTEVNATLLRRADLQPYFEHVERMDPRYFLRAMQAAAEHGAEDHLSAVDVPTLIVAGDRDRFTPTLALATDGAGDPLRRAVPGARWEPHRASGATGGSEPRCARLPSPEGDACPQEELSGQGAALDPSLRGTSRFVISRGSPHP